MIGFKMGYTFNGIIVEATETIVSLIS